MKMTIHTSMDISQTETQLVTECFPADHFELEESIFRPGMDTTSLILSFTFSSLAGGLLYDMVKAGILKICDRYKSQNNRELMITIKTDDQFYRIQGETVAKMSKEGIYLDLDNLHALFEELEERMLD